MFIAKWYSEEHSKEYFGMGEDIAMAIDSLSTSYNDDNYKEDKDIPFNDIKFFEVTSIIVEQQKVYFYKRKE